MFDQISGFCGLAKLTHKRDHHNDRSKRVTEITAKSPHWLHVRVQQEKTDTLREKVKGSSSFSELSVGPGPEPSGDLWGADF